ncbi:MAG: heme-binding protein [Acidobacteria bacterium]|nr:heme-binding protein [Acidobacteriota bacterium]
MTVFSLLRIAGTPWLAAALLIAGTGTAFAGDDDDDKDNRNACNGLPTHATLLKALKDATNTEGTGLNLNMWGTIVNRDGVVCAVAFTGTGRGSQWPGSRVISAQKANTANAFSLDQSAASGGNGGPLALSTANLFSAVQPGGSLFGLQHSNPVDTSVAYKGPSSKYGSSNDPMVGEKIGGVNVFGGGLALYDTSHKIVGAVGVSGDTSCSDHNIAWRTRRNLNLDHLGAVIPGVAGIFAGDATHPDNIIFDITANPAGGTGNSASGFGHPKCLNNPPVGAGNTASGLPPVQP